VRGEDSGYAFSICEQTLAPGKGVPMHSHASAEAFKLPNLLLDVTLAELRGETNFNIIHNAETPLQTARDEITSCDRARNDNVQEDAAAVVNSYRN
jgi:hypothetical protein